MFNKVIMAGNLTHDIELRYTGSGTAIANTAIATSRKFMVNGEKKEETCFVDITFFGRSAEVANQYLQKGSKILVEGRLKFEQWVDQTSGQKRSKHTIIVETMQMLGSRNDSTQHGEHKAEEPQPYKMPEPVYEPAPKHTDYQPKEEPQAEPVHEKQGAFNMDDDIIPI